MNRIGRGWVVAGLVVGTMTYAIAEELVLTTYYPSPRGVYNELRTIGQTTLAETSGNVGIGTTTPAQLLHVSGAGETRAQLTSTGGSTGVIFDSSNPTNALLYSHGPSGSFRLSFDGGVSDVATVTTAGNVGIGTTTPGEVLSVRVPTGGAVRIDGPNVAGASQRLQFGYTAGLAGKIESLTKAGGGGSLLFFPALNGTTQTEAMRITDAGNVGIGTTAPAERLHVVGTSRLEEIHASSGDAGDPKYTFQGDVNTGVFRPGADTWGLSTGGVERLRVDSAGNVGIGTTVPTYRLHVAGSIHATDTISVPSDARLKTDLQPLTASLTKLTQLHGLSYRRTDQPTPQRELGILGQELEQVFPELVNTSGPEDYRAVDYSRLTVVLLEALKELKAANEALQARLEALEAQLAEQAGSSPRR